jgi:hypothetical protein
MVGTKIKTRKQTKQTHKAKHSIPNGMPLYEDALNNSGAWMILVSWHYSQLDKGGSVLAQEINELVEPLFRLYQEVHARGGWLLTTGLGQWDIIGSSLCMQNPKETYEKYLFSFEKTYDPETAYFCRDEEERVQVQDIRPELLAAVPIVHPPQTGSVDSAFWEAMTCNDIILLRGFDRALDLDHSVFAVDRLLAEYPDFQVDVLTQVRMTRFYKNKSTKTRRSLKEYVQKVFEESREQRQQENVVEFAVNIDIDSWKPQVDELRKKLPRRLLWCTDDDALTDVRQHIKGMTLPQIYIKTSGCWTGGHQENLRFCAVNINHGPGDCEWWGMETSCTDAFRAKVLEEFHYDIFFQETLWWPDEDWCLANGFRLYYVLQKPGDIVFVGIGTLHWVRSLKPTVNSAWNFGLKTFKQFEAAFDRFAVNDSINFKSIVPLYNLGLDLLNFDLPNLSDELIKLLREQVNERFMMELRQLKKILKGQKPLTDSTENVVACESCHKEILYAYVKCWSCHVLRLKNLRDVQAFHCLRCHPKHDCGVLRLEFVTKFNSHELKALNLRVSSYLDKRELSMPQDGLDYTYDKYLDDEIYKSEHDGIPNLFKLEDGVLVKDEAVPKTLTINEDLPYAADEDETYLRLKKIAKPPKKLVPEVALPQKRPNHDIAQPFEREEPTKSTKLDSAELTKLLERPRRAEPQTAVPSGRQQYYKSMFDAEDMIMIPKKASN